MEVLFFSLLLPCEPLFERLVSVGFQLLSTVVERPLTVVALLVMLQDLLSRSETVSSRSFLW